MVHHEQLPITLLRAGKCFFSQAIGNTSISTVASISAMRRSAQDILGPSNPRASSLAGSAARLSCISRRPELVSLSGILPFWIDNSDVSRDR